MLVSLGTVSRRLLSALFLSFPSCLFTVASLCPEMLSTPQGCSGTSEFYVVRCLTLSWDYTGLFSALAFEGKL